MFLRTTAEGNYIFLAKDEVCQTKPHLSEKDQSCLVNILSIVAISQVCVLPLQEDLKGWVNSINASLKEIENIAKWEKATNSSTDPDKSERKERSEGAEPSEGAERSERSEKSERSERSDKIEASDKSSEKRDTSDRAERGERRERGERERGEQGDRGSRGSSISGKSKWLISPHLYLLIHPSIFPERRQDLHFSVSVALFVLTAWFQDQRIWCPLNVSMCVCVRVPMCWRLSVKEYEMNSIRPYPSIRGPVQPLCLTLTEKAL